MCGNPRSKLHIVLQVSSDAAVALFHQANSCLPKEPGKFATKLLDVFFTEEKLARSCCTRASGRELLDQNYFLESNVPLFYILVLIIYYSISLLLLIDQTNFKYPLLDKQNVEHRWSNIVHDKLNVRCRTYRRKLAAQVEKGVDKENTST